MKKCYGRKNSITSEAGARLASLAVLYKHNEADSLVEEALQGSPVQRLGVTIVAARNIGLDNCRAWSEQQLLQLFNDGDAKVRQEASTCFRSLEKQPLESFENLIKEFCMSAAYSEDSSSILYALEESSHRLPGITHMVCEKFLERFGNEARNFCNATSSRRPPSNKLDSTNVPPTPARRMGVKMYRPDRSDVSGRY